MDLASAILSDLVLDSSERTTQQLVDYVKDKQVQRLWPSRVIRLCTEVSSSETTQRIKVRVSTLVRLLFDAKNLLDADDITDFVLITSRKMKKVWERLCYRLFSHVHNWMVIGVDVADQDVDIHVPREQDLDVQIQNFLKGLESSNEVSVLRSEIFPENMFNAGFSTRQGGISCLEPLASLNLIHTIRKPDSMAVIDENRRRLAQKAGFSLDTFNVARIMHSTIIWVVEKDAQKPDRYDGVVTNTPGVTVAAPGADCCIILLADPRTGACGALHSGWLGTTKGAVRAILKTMVEEYGTQPSDVLIAIGPSIRSCCYTMPLERASLFSDIDLTLAKTHKNDASLFYVDLVKMNVLMLEADGVPISNIDTQAAKCTACHKDLFFSHRRDRIPFGNQIGFIKCLEINSPR